jgi:hypothetical protein
MATGLYITQNGSVMVSYGPKHIPISCAQYKANGYKPPLDKLTAMPLNKPRTDPAAPLVDGAVGATTGRGSLKSRR